MMGTENKKVNEVTNNENTQAEVMAVENQQPVAQPEEKKDGIVKKIWNKVKKPLLFVGIAAGAFGAGVATDHFMINKTDSTQDASGADTATDTNVQ